VQKTFDKATLIGLTAAAILIGTAIWMGGSPLAFVDVPSILIVVGGTFAVTLASFSFREMWRAQKLFMRTVLYAQLDPKTAAELTLQYAESARRTSVLQLQDKVRGDRFSPFLSKGLSMVIDGMDLEAVEHILKQDILSLMERHSKSVSVFRKSAEIAPAMGLIGTLIGLVQMLGSLDDPGSIGPAMAVALLTTLYGAIMAYVVFNPIATKLERQTKDEVLVNTVFLKGIHSISKQENPRHLETLINAVLPPEKRVRYFG
jgi:chemotaxis protein MotA